MRSILNITVFLFANCLWSQNAIDSSLVAIQNLDFSKAKNWGGRITDKTVRELILSRTRFELGGDTFSLEPLLENKLIELDRSESVRNILKGDLLFATKNRGYDAKIYGYFFDAYKVSKERKDTFLITQSLQRLSLQEMLRNRKDTAQIRERLLEYQQYLKTDTDRFWYHYNTLGALYNLTNIKREAELLSEEEFKGFWIEEINRQLVLMKKYANNNILLAYFYQAQGTNQANRLKDYKSSEESFEKARELYETYPADFTNRRKASLRYNFGVSLVKNQEYELALPILLEDLDRDKEADLLLYHYGYLSECYKEIGDLENRIVFLEKIDSLKSHIDQVRFTEIINKLNLKYNLDQLKEELKLERERVLMLQSNNTKLLLVTSLILVVLSITFLFYRRYKSRSHSLEIEKSQTLEKLEEIEEAVTTKYIVLNDKTKIYTNNLMYIKADDHYLHLHLWDSKPIVVRETLSQISKKLPPNFIRCHRSYIVNKNYTSQSVVKNNIRLKDNTLIPVSRGRKNQFEA